MTKPYELWLLQGSLVVSIYGLRAITTTIYAKQRKNKMTEAILFDIVHTIGVILITLTGVWAHNKRQNKKEVPRQSTGQWQPTGNGNKERF